MMRLSLYISDALPDIADLRPWNATASAAQIVSSLQKTLSSDFVFEGGNAIHASAVVEPGAILKAPSIIGPNCFIAAHAYLRGGVWLEHNVTIGPSSEIKSSFMHGGSKAAHFNFVGDSIVGRNVNIEAGAIIANYRNERVDKEIVCFADGKAIKTGVDKFGSVIGDGCKIGANAVLAPGTLLAPATIVPRLVSIDQMQGR
jgi:bifunctional N-acetylglucosamine-1-phosphate-uridyltransferase/glucosamine-1-phosphate-acetyltransferase GlmU-like protein